jgi:hypothetical protein
MKTIGQLMLLLALAVIPSVSEAETFTVTTVDDSGPGSLRQAILDANANPGTDTIAFNISGAGPHTIQPRPQLPEITDPVIIDGYTQPGASPNALADGDNAVLMIELDGTLAGQDACGLIIAGGESTVRGLIVNRFGETGIAMRGKGYNVIEGNFVGTDQHGSIALGNGFGWLGGAGVGTYWLGSSDNLIGGKTPAARNIISGNNYGVHIEPGSGNVLQGNFIGTDATGTLALPNTGLAGVVVGYGETAADTVIGGCELGAGNLISGNTGGGVWSYASRTRVQGNKVGTDVTGTAQLGNGNYGMLMMGSDDLVGGTTLGAGNLISGNDYTGVLLCCLSGHVVEGNLIGTDITGEAALGNGVHGVSIENCSDSRVGGTTPESRNVISCHAGYGVTLSGVGRNNLIQGNFIGTDTTGTKVLPGQWEGIMVQEECTIIGGTEAGARNVISGNVIGVDLRVPGNSVQGNLIGPDLTGTIALGNGCGIYLADSAANNTIGGTTPGTGNVISGNTLPGGYRGGIFMQGPGVTGNRVQGNLIGTDLTGTQPLGNTEGIVIFRSSNNTIGGAEPSAGNVIAHSGMAGVWVAGDEALGNTIRGNSIFDNGRLDPFSTSFPGIDLGNSWGVTPNDPLDTDAGPNNLQNYPLITSASALIGKTKIEGTLNSTPSKTFTLDFYSNAQADPSGYGEGEIYLGAATVATDLNGDVSFSVTVPVAVASGRFITATATDAEGNTSEFSGQSPPVVQDTTPPVISAVSASPAVLWPPNHKLVLVTIDYTATDDSGVASCTLSATSNEPDNGLGDGDTSNDTQVIPGDAHHLWLRAERAGTGNGRIYTVAVTCKDACGNAASKSVTVTVPKSQGKK